MGSEVQQSRVWLEQFPSHWRGAVANWFYEVVRAHGGTVPVGQGCSEVYRAQAEIIARWGDHNSVKKRDVLAAMRADPEGAKRFMAWVIQQENRTPEERERDKEELAAIGRREWMEKQPATAKQQSLLTRLGYSKEPANRWEASQLIEQLKDW